MKNIVLHIGLPKTGTTALQVHYFPKLPHDRISYNLPSIVRPLEEGVKLLDFRLLADSNVKLLKAVITRSCDEIPQENILVSMENLSQRLLKFDYQRRARFLKEIFPTAKVVLVLRNQPALLRSLYQQHVKQGYLVNPYEVFHPFAPELDDGANDTRHYLRIDVKEWDYGNVIECFRKLFASQFHVLFFEDYSASISELARAILSKGRISVRDGTFNSQVPNTNTSYRSSTMRLLSWMARYSHVFQRYTIARGKLVLELNRQAERAKSLFDLREPRAFLEALGSQPHGRTQTLFDLDTITWKAVTLFDEIVGLLAPRNYRLPHDIREYLSRQSKLMNAPLPDLLPGVTVPRQYR